MKKNAIGLTWQQLTDKCMNEVWKKVWPEVSKDSQGGEPIIGQIDNIIDTAGIDVD